MINDQSGGTALPVAVVCGEPRLRRMLRLSLEAEKYGVRECNDLADLTTAGDLWAAVVDLDSLGLSPRDAARRIAASGAPLAVPLLFISIYPHEPESFPPRRPTDCLQPPFPAGELVCRLRRLRAAAADGEATDGAGR